MTQAAAFWRLRVYETLGSTSDLCRSLAAAGEPQGLAVLARRQTAGRGSRGREWLSEPGNLFLSLLLRPAGPVRDAGMWALLAGVAVAESLDRPDIRLKWPNDILLGEAKLGGILIDSTTDASTDNPGGLAWMVIGIGVNLAAAPAIAGRATAALADSDTPDETAARILARVAHWRQRRLLEGWAPIRNAWLGHALPLGTPMTVRHGNVTGGDVTLGGTFAGLSDDGGLMLQTGGRVHSFTTGEVWLPAGTPSAPDMETPNAC